MLSVLNMTSISILMSCTCPYHLYLMFFICLVVLLIIAYITFILGVCHKYDIMYYADPTGCMYTYM